MLTVLVMNYIDNHLQLPHQVGFLTGNKTYTTYLLKLDFNKDNKRDYGKLKDNLKDFLAEHKIESNYDFTSSGISYLMDLNHDKLRQFQEFLKREQRSINASLSQVVSIGEEEK
jgi:hypothetical protein